MSIIRDEHDLREGCRVVRSAIDDLLLSTYVRDGALIADVEQTAENLYALCTVLVAELDGFTVSRAGKGWLLETPKRQGAKGTAAEKDA